ncbi:type 1 fimbrial protein [Providencia heimbachae]|uniref:fimbrial protein n=1 Tax=Providencia heimbachae TaxID=333962 RepID=UPI0010BE8AF3|nr:type 1 fimbrial protein [Providencia heimbachae]QCJ69377.1 type 1 fimbrial protein [Providencia heimbachae]
MTLFNKIVPAFIVASTLAIPAAFAENQAATITFEALVRTASCNVSSTTEGAMVNWGVFTTQDLAATTKGNAIGETKNFHLTLTECSAAATGDSTVSVFASGAASPFNPALFANAAAKSLAVELKAIDIDSTPQDILPNKETAVTIEDSIAKDGFANIPMEARLIMVNEAEVGDSLKVPVTFTVSYN